MIMTILERNHKEIYQKLTKKDKFNICNMPLGLSEDGSINFELCDLYLAVDEIKNKLTQDQIETLFQICVSAAEFKQIKNVKDEP